uniref:photosystem I assembly protein Ycf4 n=1 Tax=Dichondra micrantha TaxID=1053343 RepID=UPI001EDE37A8|nr:photosystem I assembly protein Ycf4 [Dichondra micrantha]UKO32025.1 photosystem I assembly protein Ycf4 [Dichondra micrantha]BDR61577.1 photosystem I assembly protein Ycf4 [Dichondra micrantha]
MWQPDSDKVSIRIGRRQGARKIANFRWAFILFLGSLGFLLVGICSYLGSRNSLSFFPPKEIRFFPQGIVMSFYGMEGLFISSYLVCTFYWNVGGGFDKVDQGGIVHIFRWGFPGRNRRIFFRFLRRDIRAVRIRAKQGSFSTHLVLYLVVRDLGPIPLTRTDEDWSNYGEFEKHAVELSEFLSVKFEVC